MDKEAQEIIVNPEELTKFTSNIYQKVGLSKSDADSIAKITVETDFKKAFTHMVQGHCADM